MSIIFYLISVILFHDVICYTEPLVNKKGKNVIVSNYKLCAGYAENVIKKGGNGIDAAISVMLCEGLGKPQDMGLGGGFFGIVKKLDSKETFVINSREIAPKHLTRRVFDFGTSSKIFGRVVGVPSALKGYHYLHKNHGKTKWYNIVDPIAELARKGFEVTIGEVLEKYQFMYIEEKYRNIFFNESTNTVYKNGEKWVRKDLSETLGEISDNPELFYNDPYYVNLIMEDVNKNGGLLTKEDFNIQPNVAKPLSMYFKFGEKKLLLETTDIPGGGITVGFALGVIEKYYNSINNKKINKDELNYVIAESLKFAFSIRTNFGDPKFYVMDEIKNISKNKTFQSFVLNKILKSKATHNNTSHYFQRFSLSSDHGTANIVVKTDKEIVVLTSSINLRFGSWIISKSGIIYNNQMSDFSVPNRADAGHLPPSKYNYPQPGKYPISSMSGSIISIYDNYKKTYVPKYALGGAGGPKIITAIVQVITNLLVKNMNIVDAIKSPRFHHQLDPNVLEIEKDFYIHNPLFTSKYKYQKAPNFLRGDYSAVTGIELNDNKISSSFDPRRGGSTTIF